MSRLVLFCAAHRPHPMATDLRPIQRAVTRLGLAAGRAEAGLTLARSLAMTTYRSAVESEERFAFHPTHDDGRARFPVEEYLEARGAAFVERFDAASFVALSESADLHSVAPPAVTAPTTLVSFDTDRLVPPWLVAELAERAPGVERHLTVATLFGHDAFLKETDAVSKCLRTALSGREPAR